VEPLDRRVLVGRVIGVHGVRGGVKVDSFTEPRDALLDYRPWILCHAGTERSVRAKPLMRQGKLAVSFDGIDDRDLAATLVGAEIFVDRAQLPTPGAGEFYWIDLEGLRVETMDGVDLGHVDRLFATGANDVLVVSDAGRERLIPFVQGDFVKSVDIAAGLIVVDWDPDF
jgi:16S rRNA processing protein RimM